MRARAVDGRIGSRNGAKPDRGLAAMVPPDSQAFAAKSAPEGSLGPAFGDSLQPPNRRPGSSFQGAQRCPTAGSLRARAVGLCNARPRRRPTAVFSRGFRRNGAFIYNHVDIDFITRGPAIVHTHPRVTRLGGNLGAEAAVRTVPQPDAQTRPGLRNRNGPHPCSKSVPAL